jgi:putative endonuclease
MNILHRSAGRYTAAMPCWYVYLLECRDGSLYTGIATDVERRYAEHVAGKGARYTRSHPPSRLLARFPCPDRSTASRAEYAIKQLSPARKRALCADANGSALLSGMDIARALSQT